MQKDKKTKANIPNKIKALIILFIVATLAIYIYVAHKQATSLAQPANSISIGGRPLPDLSTAQKRVNSYQPAPGDFKYRIVAQPVITEASTTGWNLYTSAEYNFSFTFPQNAKILDNTEALGYQLPPSQAYKGSRDNFQIVIQGKNNSYFLLFLNDPSPQVANNKLSSASMVTENGIKMTKQIFTSSDPLFSSSQVITYSFQQGNHNFLWYGAFDAKDFESINDFESIVASMKFK